jgi:Replicase family/Primase C terminal 1 (PriCT-1)
MDTSNVIEERLYNNIFCHPYASLGKDPDGCFSYAKRMDKEQALEMPVLQINGPRRISYLCFDVDKKDAGISWIDANLPTPTIIVKNPENGHAHIIYELDKPIWLAKTTDNTTTDPPPIRYMKAVRQAITKALGADTSYNGIMTKNPYNSKWHTVYGSPHPYTLRELSCHLELEKQPYRARIKDDDVCGRRAILFETIRRWAYMMKSSYYCESDFYDAIFVELQSINQTFVKGPELLSELRSIARSVSRWVWKYYTRNSKRVGIMNLNPKELLRMRQQKGQKFTSSLRKERTFNKLIRSIAELHKSTGKITQTLLAKTTNISRTTIRFYWILLLPYIKNFSESLNSKINTNILQISLNENFSNNTSIRPTPSVERYPDTIPNYTIPTPSTPSSQPANLMTYPEVISNSSDRSYGIIRAYMYAVKQAREGVLVDGIPSIMRKELEKIAAQYKNN